MTMQPSVRRRTTLHSRIMRRIYLIVMGAAMILSVILLLGAVINGRQQLVLSQEITLNGFAEDISDRLAIYAGDVRRVAESRSARDFARDTVVNVQSSSLAASQNRLLGDFTSLLEANPGRYLAIRYVTSTGSIWSAVTNYSGGRPTANAQVGLNYFRDDPTLLSSLSLVPGQVAALPLNFYSTPETRASSSVVPFIRFATPVSVEGNTLGLIQLDVRANELLDDLLLQYNVAATDEPSRRMILIDSVGRVILDSATGGSEYLRALADRRGVPVGSLITELGTVVLSGDELAVDAGSVVYSTRVVGLGSPVDLGWRLLLVDDELSAQRFFISAGLAAAVLVLGLGALICVILNIVIGRSLRYVQTLGAAAQPWLQSDQQTAPPSTSSSADISQESGTLSAAVRTGTYARVRRGAQQRDDLLNLAVLPTLSAVADAPDDIRQLMEAFKTADEYVQQVAAESREQVQRYARNLDIAARISRQTATLYDLDQLLNRAINLICAEYGFYHAQVFLIDDAGLNAVLRYSYGEAGRKMLEEGHRLPVGSQSVIGQVTATGQAVIVHDTEAPGSPHRFNPLLPQTRTEMALPLTVGQDVIGALDIQHSVPNSFRDDELSTFQLLADQIALAVANARLIQQVRAQTEALQSASGAPLSWTDANQIAARSYRYDLVEVEPGTLDLPTDQRASIPISIRGEVIGSLEAAQPETGFSEGDLNILRAVADRVSLVIENARLFEETQDALQQTSMLYDLSRALNEAEAQEDILRAILRSAMPDASGAQIGLFDEYLPGTRPAWMQITADVAMQPELRSDVLLTGIQLALSDHPILNTMQSYQIVLVNDVERDNRLDETLRAVLHSLSARSLVIIPFVVRAAWRGVIMAQFPHSRTFSEREGRLFNALIDQAGVAIDNRMLLRENELALEQIERLYTASRITNMAESAVDLVMAALATTTDRRFSFELGIYEGGFDDTGWPTRLRIVAVSDGDRAIGDSRLYVMPTPKDSPLRSRESQITIDRRPDEPNNTPMIAFLRERGRKFAAVFPLFSANQPLALLFITAPEPVDLTNEDYEVYRALTGQMSTVLQNRRLLDQTAAALDETRRLYTASRAIAAAPDAETIYQAAVTYVAQGSQTLSRVVLLAAGPQPSFDAAFMEVVTLWQRDPTFVPDLELHDRVPMMLIPYNGLLASQRGQAAVFNDAERELIGSFAAFGVMMRNHGSKSVALVEIRARQAWYGVIQCESPDPNAFDEAFIRYVSAIADQTAIAVDSLALFRQAQEQAQRALALAEAGQLASQIGVNFESSLREVFRRVAEAAEYDRWALMLADEARTRLEVQLIEYAQPGLLVGEDQFFSLSDAGISFVDAFLQQRPIPVNQPLEYGAFMTMLPSMIEELGKHLVVPIMLENQPVGVVSVGRGIGAADLDDRDIQLVRTLAAQVAAALENRRLFEAAESERGTLRSILETLPAGVLVLSPDTLQPIQTNQQVEQLLGQPIDPAQPFSAARYNLYRTGTSSLYEDEALPSNVAARSRDLATSDDITVIHPNGWRVNLLINAAPILNEAGRTIAIVTAMQDITTLRALEDTLQTNLQETIALYDTTRALAEAEEIDDVLDRALERMILQEPTDAYILLLDDDLQGVRVARALQPDAQFTLPENVLDVERALFVENTAAPFDELRRERFAVDRDSADQMLLAGVRAIVSLPLRSRSRRDVPLGWLVMTYSEPTTFGLEREQFLTTLADSVAIALDNRYLFRSTQQALRETAALYGAATAISRSHDYASISSALMNALAALAPDFYAAYLLREGKLEQIFNEDQDGAPADFMALIREHDLLNGAAVIYHDDVRASDAPTLFDESLIALGNVRGIAVVTLRSGDSPIGCMIVGYHQPHRFTASESRYLSAIADSASVVLNNLALFDQIEDALSETRILYETSRALSDASTPQDILRAIVDHMTDRPVDQVLFLRLSTEDWLEPGAAAQVVALWQPREHTGSGLEGALLTNDQFPAWRILASPSVVMIDDVTTDSTLDPIERMGIENLDIRALAVLPLRVTGRDLGAILITTHQPYSHSYRDLRIYRSLAEQASLRVEASRLIEQTERRARQLVTSAQVSQIASSILDLNYLFPRIVDLIRESFRYDHVQIFMMDENNEYAELRASTGEPGRQLLSIKHKLAKGSRSVIGQVTARGEPFIAADTLDARVIHRPNPYLPNTRSEMAIPLLLKGRVVGALDVQSNTPNAFKDDDVAVLTTLANQIAVAIDNARLYEDAQKRASEMSFLFSTTSAAAAASTLEEALENIANELRNSLDALSVTIYLPEAYLDSKGNPFTLLRAAALSGTDQPMSEVSEIRLDAHSNLIATVANDRYPLLIGDITAEPNYLPVIDGAQSAAIVPLTVAGQLVGLITMESATLNAYDDDTLTLLLTLSGSLSAIIQNQQLLEQVQKTNQQLLELDQLKSQFLANMSHELRTPLNSIIGFSRVILKGIDGPLTEMQEQDLTTIYNSGQHLLNLINDILDQAKIAAGKMDLQMDFFEIKGVIDAVRSIGIGLVKDKPIDIFVELAPGLPQVYGDEFRTRQVLLNLVSNAAKFTREGSINIVAYVEAHPETGAPMVRVDVTDTGIGIAEKDMSVLFEAFRQVDSSLTRTQGGTGLGLPIAKSLIEMQGGQMYVRSQVNVGSTFSITLPTQPVEGARKPDTGSLNGKDMDDTGEIEPVVTTRDTIETGPLRFVRPIKRQLLLIEDDPDMVDQFRRVLQREGFEIYTASIPLEAKPMASGLHPTIILMDVNFAEGAGWEILEWLKSRDDTRDIPVVIVSLTDEAQRVLEMGAFRFVRRPFTPEQIAEAVREAEMESRISRILIIDDHDESVRILQNALQENGKYRVYSAHNGAEGIAQVARRRPDLVILDLRMPEMDGFQVIRELRNNPETATIPILVVTADTLDPSERDQLNNLEVIYKQDINLQARRFIEGVRMRLNRDN